MSGDTFQISLVQSAITTILQQPTGSAAAPSPKRAKRVSQFPDTKLSVTQGLGLSHASDEQLFSRGVGNVVTHPEKRQLDTVKTEMEKLRILVPRQPVPSLEVDKAFDFLLSPSERSDRNYGKPQTSNGS